MRRTARMGRRVAVLLASGGWLWALGGCLPENYIGDLLIRLTTGAADVAVQTLVFTAIDAAFPDSSGTSTDATETTAE